MRKYYLTWEYTLAIIPITTLVFLYWQELKNIPAEYYYFGIPLLFTFGFFLIQSQQRKDDKSDSEITFIENEGTFILNTVGFSIKELKLQNNKTPIDKKSILFQATILNSGTKDIDKQDFHKPLAIKLGKGYKWKTIDITHKSEDIGLSLDFNKNTLFFEWELLRSKEFFKFDSIIEFNEDYKKENIISIFHGVLKYMSFSGSRIKNVKFQRTNFAKGESIIWKIKISIPFMMLMLFNYIIYNNPEKIINHHIVTVNKDTLCVNYEISKDNLIIIKDTSGKILDNNKFADSNWITQKIEVVDNLSWKEIKPMLIKPFVWLSLLYLILLLIRRNYYLRRKEIDDFIAYPYRGNPNKYIF